MVRKIIQLIKNRRIFCVSLLFNIVLSIMLVYVVCIKTDLYDRLLSKVGVGTYSVAESRHHIEFRCIEGWANTLYKMNLEANAVFYGNSITFENNFQEDYPQLLLCNMGCNRDDLDDMINRAFMIGSVRPKKIFILGGINGFINVHLGDFKRKYEMLVDTIKAQNPHSQLFLQSMLPVNVNLEIGSRYAGKQEKIKEANEIIRDISLNKKCTYVDLYSAYQIHDSLPKEYTRDGLHLYPEAYSIWSRIISSYLND